MKIGFVGMTHLGINSAVGAAEKGFSVICFDPNREQIEKLKEGELPFVEPDLPQLLEKNWERIHFSNQLNDLPSCDVIYVAPDISTNDRGESDLTPLRHLLATVFSVLNDQIVVLLSQIPPGFTRKIDYRNFFYQVETLIFGRAIERTLYPERFILGTKEPLPKKLLDYLSAYNCPIFPMSFESAELTKIAINMFLVSSVTTSNTIAELCEKIGADWSEIVPTLQLDKRIGKKAYLAPGLGIAGGNLERDLETFSSLADANGTDATVVKAWKAHSKRRCDWVLNIIHKQILTVLPNPRFAILGLAYKENTSSVKNSPSLALIKSLQNFELSAYDPVVKTVVDCFPSLEIKQTAEEACDRADVLLIMTPWSVFQDLPPFRGKFIVDPYGVMQYPPSSNYFKLGACCAT
ncbi:MAG: UDP-glucose 6-dehydrogenase TuaD [Chlamydiales bacterium]|nr:UDP-glucose 6-dehydrogenase TuaD [Chlamydiales bacterium]MCH9619485.1 UDP-glucose 6-dehydrogenase TuaD [Chlamydiales bacterium]MCH9622289.1 UDP-glucose 6-dehydrogenase TuaD [Chlamydiales bacterium]